MLSYILPVESSKPSDTNPSTQQQPRLQLSLLQGRFANGNSTPTTATATTTSISKETSVSSFASDATTATISHNTSSSMTNTSASDRLKTTKVVANGKHQTLKRVSFGSSKGSMVETLIYESPLQEDGQPSPICENVTQPFPEDCEQTEAEREKVRVSFFQQSKPQEVDLPDETCFITDTDFMMATTIAENDAGHHICYNRTESTESGWDNPFRPGGDLSKEADEIVELIKEGKPITPTPDGSFPPLPSLDEPDSPKTANAVNESHQKAGAKGQNLAASPMRSANGNVQKNEKPVTPGALEVQRGTAVQPGDASQVEHVTIKKKPKCKCCVIQ